MSNLDKIIIEGLEVSCIIGVLDKERISKQPVVIDIELSLDLSIPSKSDDIADTLDYFKIYEDIVSLAEKSSFYLIEKLAEQIADLCLQNDLVKAVKVSVKKPNALEKAKFASVQIKRSK